MNEKLSKILNDPRRVPISVGVVAFGVGIGLGYILGRRTKNEVNVSPTLLNLDLNADKLAELKRRKETSVIPTEEIIEIPESVSIVGKSFVAEKLEEIDPTTEDVDPTVEEIVDEVVRQSIFANGKEWTYAAEIKKRDPSEPYIIHRDEFYSEEKGYSQHTLTYYAGDNIMNNDEEESPMYNHDGITGPLRFGHGSDDPNVVYIRNDKRKVEYEILYDPGLYSEEVLGLEIENNQRAKDIKHSNNRRFRLE